MAKLMSMALEDDAQVQSPEVAIECLRLMSQGIVTEMMSLSDLSPNRLLNRVFPDLLKSFKSVIGLTDQAAEGIKLPPEYKHFQKVLNERTYGDLANLTMVTPEGFNGKYLAYVTALQFAGQHALKVQERISGFSTLLALILSNAGDNPLESRSSVPKYNEFATQRKQAQDQINPFFTQGSMNNSQPYAALFQSNKDWEPVLNMIGSLVNDMNSINRNTLKKQVRDAAELVDTFGDRLKAKTLPEMAGERVAEIAEGAYQVAAEVEFFVSIYYYVKTCQTALSLSVEKLENFKLAPSTEGWFGGAKKDDGHVHHTQSHVSAFELLNDINAILKTNPKDKGGTVTVSSAQAQQIGEVRNLVQGSKDFLGLATAGLCMDTLNDISHEIRSGDYTEGSKSLATFLKDSQKLSQYKGKTLFNGLFVEHANVASMSFYLVSQKEPAGKSFTIPALSVKDVRAIVATFEDFVEADETGMYGMDGKDMYRASEVCSDDPKEALQLFPFCQALGEDNKFPNILMAESYSGVPATIKAVLHICKDSLVQ